MLTRIFRRAIALHPASVLVLMAVFALFLWLNFNTTRTEYLMHTPQGWRGGVREGFPTAWWDGGSVVTGVADNDGVALRSTPFGGWQPRGIVLGVLSFGAALLIAGTLSELLARRLSGAAAPLEFRSARIRLATALISLVLLCGIASSNLIVITSIASSDAEGSAAMSISQSMGWPFQTYVASAPVLVSPAGSVEQAPIRWTRAHWSSTGIVLDAFAALLIIGAAASATEWLARKAAQSK